MLSLAELRRAARVLEAACAEARLDRIVQVDAHRLVLTWHRRDAGDGGARTLHVALCCGPGLARVGALDVAPKAPPAPPAFAQYLRAHLEAARCSGTRIVGDDRQLALRLIAREGQFDLLLSVLGPRSNLYLLDADDRVVAAMRPFAETRRDLERGAVWSNPATSPPPEGEDRWLDVVDAGYLQAIEETYAALEIERERADLRRQLAQAIKKEAEFLDRKEAQTLRGLDEAQGAEEWRRRGELLKSVLHRVQPGDTSVTAVDYETGAEVALVLEADRSPAENLQRYFKKYQKAARAAEVLRGQLAKLSSARAEIEDIDRRFRALPAGDAAGALEALAGEPVVRRRLGRRIRVPAVPEQRPKLASRWRELPSRLRPRRYRTGDGLEIWVGRTDEGNDYLTTRLAHGNDLFFHLEGAPGSHVVLRCGGCKDPPPEAVIDACEIAVHYSKARGDSRADVHVAAIKDIKKPAGAKPGLVHVMRGKTIHLRRDPRRLERVLADRIEEG